MFMGSKEPQGPAAVNSSRFCQTQESFSEIFYAFSAYSSPRSSFTLWAQEMKNGKCLQVRVLTEAL